MPSAARSTPGERTLHSRVAAFTKWSQTDPVAGTMKARRTFMDNFERQVDPDGTLPPDERARRAACARKAHFTKLALLSAQARRRRGGDAA